MLSSIGIGPRPGDTHRRRWNFGRSVVQLDESFARYLIVPLVTGVLAYAFGQLQARGSLVRERKKALNAVLYSLLELRWEIMASDPEVLLRTLNRFIRERFGECGDASTR